MSRFLAPAVTAPLRAVLEAELEQLATFSTVVSVRQPNGEYLDLPQVVEADVPVMLTRASVADAEIAAARGVEMQFRLVCPLGTPVTVGMTGAVTGADDDGNGWTRAVRVTATDLPGEMVRVCAAVDTSLNQ